jgi:hypothetical protein
MGQGLYDFDTVVQAIIQDGAGKLSVASRLEAIRDAVAEHAHLVPILRRRYLYGTGSTILGTPTGWVDEFSAVQRIEFPVGTNPPTYLQTQDWTLLSSPTAATTYQIQFVSMSLGTGQRVNLEWTIPHTIDETSSTIPDAQFRPVGWLASSYALLQLAAFYNQSGDSTIGIDSQDPGSKGRDYLALARELRNRYRLFFGLGAENGKAAADVQPAGIFIDLDRKTSYRGNWFTHDNRYR